jgi:hypothetical protein
MPTLPVRLFLSEALSRIAARLGLSSFRSGISARLHGALREGTLIAHGREEDGDGRVLHADHPVPGELWSGMTPAQFAAAAREDRRLPLRPEKDPRPIATRYFAQIAIEASAIESWLTGGQPAESKLASAQNEAGKDLNKPIKNRPGRKGDKVEAATEIMVAAVESGGLTREELAKIPQKQLEASFPETKAKKTTLSDARTKALQRLPVK